MSQSVLKTRLRAIRWPRLLMVSLVAVAAAVGFARLGLWQLHRLSWKLDLIERVDARIHADAVAAPGPADWAGLTAAGDEYRRVRLNGHFLHDQTVLIYTPSDYGPADWVLTPLARDDGTIVMVNRGLVPEQAAHEGKFGKPEGEVTVTGLLRMSEDKGWLFSRPNNPEQGLWYRRDIGSITRAKGFAAAAPYFVDEEAGGPIGWPRGGATVVRFRNAHLGYALTWFTMAVLVLVGHLLILHQEMQHSRRASSRLNPSGWGK